MRSLMNITAFGIILALLAAILYFVFNGSVVVWQQLNVLDDSTKVVLLSTIVTAFVLTMFLLYGMRSAANTRLRSQLAERRQALYVHVLTVLRAIMDKDYSQSQREDFESELMASNAEFMLLASSPTIKAYLAFKLCLEKDGEQALLEACFQALWKKMRTDLGFKNDYEIIDVKDVLQSLPAHGLLTVERTEKEPDYHPSH